MYYNQIKVGDKIRFSLKREKGNDKKYYDSSIVKIHDHEKVFVMEEPGPQFSSMESGSLYEFVFHTKMGNFSCDCTIIRTYVEQWKNLTTVRVVSPVVRAQLRSFPRYQVDIPVWYNKLEDNKSIEDEPSKTIDGVVKDIGGGGLRLFGSVAFPENTTLRLMMEKQDGAVIAEGIVISCIRRVKTDDRNKYEIRIKFKKTGGSRRKKPRTSCRLPMRYAILEDGEYAFSNEESNDRMFYYGLVLDINENGVRLASNNKLDIESRLYLEVEGKDKVLIAEGKVVSKHKPTPDNGGYRYENGVKMMTKYNKNGVKLSDIM